MNTLHLFAGAGGGIIADMMLGHNPIGAVEIDKYCQNVLKQRQDDGLLPSFPIYSDVQEFHGNEINERVDMVCGGFPCQDISCAGKGAGIRGKRSGMFFELTRICNEIRPAFIFLENSPNIRNRGLEHVLKEIAILRYDAQWCCLPASAVGALHERNRWWCLCRNSDITISKTFGEIRQRTKAQSGGILRKIPDTEARDSRIGETSDGFRQWWETEPELGRVADGVAHRVDRLKAIGNGQVPACAAAAQMILFRRYGIDLYEPE